jgi:RNA recognition motif-containing protein
MPQKVYVGNLPYRTTENDLRKLFKKYEPIHSLILISDKETEQPRGYGFIELDEPKAGYALSELGDTDFNGRNLKIRVATGKRAHKKKASAKRAPEKKTHGKAAPETQWENKRMATVRMATPRRNRRTAITEHVISNANNYG